MKILKYWRGDRKYDIPAASHRGLHKLCYLQIVICWQGLCHDTLLTYLLHLQQQSRAAALFSAGLKSAAASTLSPSDFTLININTLPDELYERSHFHCGVARLGKKQNKSSVYIPHPINSSATTMLVFFLSSSLVPIFWFLLCVLLPETPAFEIGLGENEM